MENEQTGVNASGKNKKILIVVIAILIVLLVGVSALAATIAIKSKKAGSTPNIAETTSDTGNGFAYEASVITGADDAAKAEEEIQKAAESYMTLEMKMSAYSSDGVHFDCYLGNSLENSYDMYLEIYLDETNELLYRSGLIPIGARIESFESSVKLDSGTHMTTIVFHQIEDDHVTEYGNVAAAYEITVQ